jgi:hypothetical protein
MSQTLSLIVAAMVLMMTALTLIFMTQGSLEDLFSGSEQQSCISTAETNCNIRGGDINVPACEGYASSSADSFTTDSGSSLVECG